MVCLAVAGGYIGYDSIREDRAVPVHSAGYECTYIDLSV